MAQRVEDWIAGVIQFTDDDRYLAEKTGEITQLGLYVRHPIDVVIFLFYNIGYTLVEDQAGIVFVLNIVGFEDGLGNKFSFPFHLGPLDDSCKNIHLERLSGQRINQGRKITFDRLTSSEFLLEVDSLIGLVNMGTTYSDSYGRSEIECLNSRDTFFVTAGETTKALAEFFECNNCSIADASPLISRWINFIPTEFNLQIPYLPFYDVSYW